MRKFLRSSCRARRFTFESSELLPIDNCLCWYEYKSSGGILTASLRYFLFALIFAQPFSMPKVALLRLFGAKIHRHVYISPQVFVDSLFPSLLTIEEGVLLGLGSRIALHEHSRNRFSAGRVTIHRGTTIGADSKIACGVEIGEFAVTGIGAVVLRDVPPHSLVLGNPARVVKSGK